MFYLRSKNYSTHTNTTYVETPPDNILMIVVVFIVVFGIMAVFSASAPKAIGLGENPISFVLKQSIWLIMGIFGAYFFSKFDYKRLKIWASPLTILVLITLLLVQFSPLGVTVNEANAGLSSGLCYFSLQNLQNLP